MLTTQRLDRLVGLFRQTLPASLLSTHLRCRRTAVDGTPGGLPPSDSAAFSKQNRLPAPQQTDLTFFRVQLWTKPAGFQMRNIPPMASENPHVLSCPQATPASFMEPDIHVRLPQLACRIPVRHQRLDLPVIPRVLGDIVFDSKRPESSSWTIVAPLGRWDSRC